jgi:hypothetical protein
LDRQEPLRPRRCGDPNPEGIARHRRPHHPRRLLWGGGAGAIVTLIAWWILESAINRRTRARCAAQAWATVNEKLAKEAAIRDATHQSALARIAP